MKLLYLAILAILLCMPVSAYEETQFTVIENMTMNDISFANQTAIISFAENGTPIYSMSYPPMVVKSVPLGYDLQIGMQIVQTFFIVIIAMIMLVRATYDLASWVKANRKV